MLVTGLRRSIAMAARPLCGVAGRRRCWGCDNGTYNSCDARCCSVHSDQFRAEERSGGGVRGLQDEKTDMRAGPTSGRALPPARRGAAPAGRRRRPRRGQDLLDPALGRQRQEQLHRPAGRPTDRANQGRRAVLRLDYRGHRPGHPGPSDPGHEQAVRAGGGDGQARGPVGRPAPVHRERQEDHHLHAGAVGGRLRRRGGDL